MAAKDHEVDRDDLRAVTGALRYAFRVSDSVLLKLYAIAFLLVSGFLTVLLVLALITWMGRLQGAPPVGSAWGFLPFLVVVYLAVEAVLFAPLYLPMRRYRGRSGEVAEEPGDADDA